jgi:hypothetical protein
MTSLIIVSSTFLLPLPIYIMHRLPQPQHTMISFLLTRPHSLIFSWTLLSIYTLLAMAPLSSFTTSEISIEHNGSGANCFITNNKAHFVNFISTPIHVKQLDGSIASALGYGLKLVQHPPSGFILPRWPTYYMPKNPHCTFSPTALKFNLQYPSVLTKHLQSLEITTHSGLHLQFPSIPTKITTQLLNFHLFHAIKPIKNISLFPSPTASKALTSSSLTRALIHQRLGHGSDRKLDLMCRLQTLTGLPKCPFPPNHNICPICVKAKFTHPPKGKTMNTSHLSRGEYLHMDFSFWNIPSLCHHPYLSLPCLI